MIRVVVADDQALVRGGLCLILDAHPDIDVVGEASDGSEALARCAELSPDVVLMDIRMPGVDGIQATRHITAAGRPAKIIMLTTFDLDEYVYEAMRAGASGFLLKTVAPRQLTAAVIDVAAGDTLLAPEITRRFIERFVRRPPPGTAVPPALDRLTPRELEVVRLIGQGLSNHEIATRLVVAQTTAKTHVSRVMTKLGLRDRVQAVVLAYESGLLEPGTDPNLDSS